MDEPQSAMDLDPGPVGAAPGAGDDLAHPDCSTAGEEGRKKSKKAPAKRRASKALKASPPLPGDATATNGTAGPSAPEHRAAALGLLLPGMLATTSAMSAITTTTAAGTKKELGKGKGGGGRKQIELPTGETADAADVDELTAPPEAEAATGTAAAAAGAGEGQPPVDAEEPEPEEAEEVDEADTILLPRTQEEREGMRVLLASFTPEQQQRYEAYRRAHLPKAALRRFLTSLTDWSTFPPTATIILGGAGKLFVGEIVEEAIAIQRRWGDPPGPLRPQHLREAFRLYRQRTGTIHGPLFKPRLF